MIHIKKQLYHLCLAYAEQRIDTAHRAIKAAQESANDDTKSSAGDKYETGREMMQQEIDRNRTQLKEAQHLKQTLDLIDPEKATEIVQNGSLVFTNYGAFYIAISCGQLSLEGKNYFAISSASPIGIKLMRQRAGARFDFNGKEFKISDVQ
jgi:transcription elongation GreA/GreB family factor